LNQIASFHPDCSIALEASIVLAAFLIWPAAADTALFIFVFSAFIILGLSAIQLTLK
jgi:hypothetical protein